MDYLLLLSELAVAFAGFTAVVAVFQPEGGPEEHQLNKVRLQQMLELSLLTVGAGLLPFVLASFGLAESRASRVAAVVVFPAAMALFFFQFRRGFDPRVRQLPGYNLAYARFLVLIGIVGNSTLAVAALVPGGAMAWYQLGVTMLLGAASMQFYRTATSALRTFK